MTTIEIRGHVYESGDLAWTGGRNGVRPIKLSLILKSKDWRNDHWVAHYDDTPKLVWYGKVTEASEVFATEAEAQANYDERHRGSVEDERRYQAAVTASESTPYPLPRERGGFRYHGD